MEIMQDSLSSLDQPVPQSAEDAGSAGRYQSLVMATGQIVWTNSPEGQMLGEQPGWSGLTGQSHDEYQGFGWADAVHEDDRQPSIDSWNEAVRTRGVFAFEHRVRRSDGVYRHFSVRAVPVLNDDGSIREWVGIHTDITERLEQQEALRASEERYRILAEMLPILVWTARPDGTFDYVSPAFTALGQKPTEALLGGGWHSLVHPSDLPEVLSRWRESLASGSPYEVEARLLRASEHRYVWHNLKAVPMLGGKGTVTKWIGSGSDIDGQKRLTEVRDASLTQVKAERERLRRVFMGAPSVMALYRGPEYIIDMVNPPWETFVGKRNVIGKKVREVFPEVEGQGVFEILDRVRDTGEQFRADELRVMIDRNNDGHLVETFWSLAFQPLLGPDGRTADIVVHAQEISELVNTRRELAECAARAGA